MYGMNFFNTRLGMGKEWDDINENNFYNIEAAYILLLTKWKETTNKTDFKTLQDVLSRSDISTHILCQVSLRNYLSPLFI